MITGPLTVSEHRSDVERIARAKLILAMDRAASHPYSGKRADRVVENLEHWWRGLAQNDDK